MRGMWAGITAAMLICGCSEEAHKGERQAGKRMAPKASEMRLDGNSKTAWEASVSAIMESLDEAQSAQFTKDFLTVSSGLGKGLASERTRDGDRQAPRVPTRPDPEPLMTYADGMTVAELHAEAERMRSRQGPKSP